MSKSFSVIFLALFSIILTVLATPTYALDACKQIQITPPPPLILPLYSNAPRATFTLDVGGTTGYGGWKIGFPTGYPCSYGGMKHVNASVLGDGKSISAEVENSYFLSGDFNCTFSAGPHALVATAVRTDGSEVKICEASYSVLDANAQCSLTIYTDPPNQGITPASTVLVSGTGLIPRETFNPFGYKIFLDNKKISGNVDTRNSSTFSGFKIPGSNLTPGLHQVDLRYPIINLTPSIGIPDDSRYFTLPLCHAFFTVGTPDKPGGVVTSGTGGRAKVCTGEGCTIAIGTQCDKDPQNPGIATAIGCIHTSPVGFIRDFLKFILGISGGLAFLMMLLGAFQMLTSAGNPDTLVAGRERLTSAIIGLLFIVFAVLLLQIIGVDILGIPGFVR